MGRGGIIGFGLDSTTTVEGGVGTPGVCFLDISIDSLIVGGSAGSIFGEGIGDNVGGDIEISGSVNVVISFVGLVGVGASIDDGASKFGLNIGVDSCGEISSRLVGDKGRQFAGGGGEGDLNIRVVSPFSREIETSKVTAVSAHSL
jgi:hypothetical protein